MTTATVGGISCRIAGTQGPWVVMSHSLGCSKAMWDAQVRALASRFQVLTYDLPGHGDSAAVDGHGSLAALAFDVVRLLDWIGAERAHFVGLSIGGMIGQQLALSAGDRLDRLVLANCGFETPVQARPLWRERMAAATRDGVESLVSPTMSRWFTEEFRHGHPQAVADIAAQFGQTSLQGYRYCCEAILGLDLGSSLSRVRSPTLVLTGGKDVAVPPSLAEQLAHRIPRAELGVLEDSGHLSAVDAPSLFNRFMEEFL